ncbi:PBP1A family penicillin-binding protein [Methylobrevis pamukkalensis]|uniref:Penicillin-binding protein 2D n=1 Tax=Methylobrevis pamukkalensis TaxID=1439726 RepID=A0A1E3H7E7_9HYPH|nr:PBP1A family penicillin-binding protein [Methylobrevis pamukkalensis]ODN72242.1 Penicillin-binding protein 2D [Methylobrevis pamukkalensis]
MRPHTGTAGDADETSAGAAEADARPPTQGGPTFRDSRAAARALLGALAGDARDALGTLRRNFAGREKIATALAFRPRLSAGPRPGLASKRRNLPALRRRRGLVAMVAGVVVLAPVAFASAALSDVAWDDISVDLRDTVVVLEDQGGAPLIRPAEYRAAHAPRSAFPPILVDAVLSVEDRRFYDHFGIDVFGIGRASLANLAAGRVVQGGSTLTQQLVKVSYLETGRTWKRKFQELVLTLWLEHKLDKDEILTRYLNAIYLGSGATGMPAAAEVYFAKDVADLTPAEAAMLAGIIHAPSVRNPLADIDGARRRAHVVVGAMVDNGRLSANDARAVHADIDRLQPAERPGQAGRWFSDWVGPDALKLAGADRGTVRFRTTMDPDLQALAEEVVTETLAREGAAAGATEGALVAMRPDGAVVALVGGADHAANAFNRATSAKRQPGSAFKLFVYYAALKAGLHPRDRISDRPIEVEGWEPENYDGQHRGRVSLAEAFARSLNAATVRLAEHVGRDKVVAAARELGIDADLPETASLALGTAGMSLLDLTGAYASVRAGVAPIEPYGLLSYRGGQGRSTQLGSPKQPAVDLTPYQNDLVGMLRTVVERGTGREARLGGFAAGKTGTSQNHRDAWFVGFTEPLVVGVWVGNDDETPMREVTGGGLPAEIWRRFMERAAEVEMDIPPAERPAAATQVAADGAMCNIDVCSRFYRSFRASDCSYQPYRGARRLCER